MPGTGSYKRTTQNQGGGPAKYGTAISLIGVRGLLARVISRRAYENTSVNNEPTGSTITLFDGIFSDHNELKNKILFSVDIDVTGSITTTPNLNDLSIGGSDGIVMRLTIEGFIKHGFNLDEEIQTIRIIQGNNDYSLTGTIGGLNNINNNITLTISNITVITDNNGGSGGDGIYNIIDPITIRFSLPSP